MTGRALASPPQSDPQDFALMRGGPLFELMRRFGLEAPEHSARSGLSRSGFAVAVAWLPLLVLCWWEGSLASFIRDRRVHAELLLALPVLLAGESYVNGRLAEAARRPLLLGLLSPEGLGRYRETLVRASRARDRGWVEGVLLLLAFGMTFLQSRSGQAVPPFAVRGDALTAAGAWYAFLSYPLMWLVLLRWGWRFLIWSGVLLRLSGLGLKLTATHADRTGGLYFLAVCQASFSVVVFALACVVSAMTRGEAVLLSSEGLLSYARHQVMYALTALLFLNLPLLPFTPKLLEAKRLADARFSVLMARHGQDFEAAWFGEPVQGLTPMVSHDMSSQADISSAFERAERMRWFPYGLRPLLAVMVAGLVLPLIPRLLSERQLLEALQQAMPGMF